MVISLPDKAILAITVGALAMMLPGLALSKSNPARVHGSDLTKTLDCAGNSVRIFGSNNKVTLTGGCTRLTILGPRNVVTVAFGAGGSIWFGGSKNEWFGQRLTEKNRRFGIWATVIPSNVVNELDDAPLRRMSGIVHDGAA